MSNWKNGSWLSSSLPSGSSSLTRNYTSTILTHPSAPPTPNPPTPLTSFSDFYEAGRQSYGRTPFVRNVDPLVSFLRNASWLGFGFGSEGEGVGEARAEYGYGYGYGGRGWNESGGGYDRMDATDDQWSVEDAFVEGSHLWWLLVAGYCIVFSVGVVGNAVLLAALCGSGSRARALPVRNHLMVNLAAADLLVTAVCVPISACAAASHACWPSFLVAWMCELGPLLQRTPVAASTLSLALLSLDRWAALRHPRFAQRFRDKRFVLMSMGIIWIVASLVSAPTFWAREWEAGNGGSGGGGGDQIQFPAQTKQSNNNNGNNTSSLLLNTLWGNVNNWTWTPFDSGGLLNGTWKDPTPRSPSPPSYSSSSSSSSSPWQSWEWTGMCTEHWTNAGIQLAYAATYLGTAFVSPALIVAACHASVSQKLTAQLQVLSGGGAGADKTRPRPKQVIIVARELTAHTPNHMGNGKNGETYFAGDLNENGTHPQTNTLHPPHDHLSKLSRKVIPCDPNSDEDDVYLRMQIQADLESFRQLSQLQQNQRSHHHHHHGTINQQQQQQVGGAKAKVGGGSKSRPGLITSFSFKSIKRGVFNKREAGLGEKGAGEEVEEEEPKLKPQSEEREEENVGVEGEETSSKRGRSDDDVKVVCGYGDGDGDGDAEEGSGVGGLSNNCSHPLKAARRETSIIRAHRRLRKKLSNPLRAPPPLLPTYSSQSFRSRRRAANLLAALAAVFVLCWAPYVVCALWDLFAKDKSIVRLLIPFALFLGHAHSAINPVVSWRLNRSAFVRFQRQPFRSLLPDWSLLSWCRACTCPCCPCCCCCCCFCCPGVCCGDCDASLSPSTTPRRPHVKYPGAGAGAGGRFGRGGNENYGRGGGGRRLCPATCYSCPIITRQFRRSSSPEGWNRNSSTNEAALGAFHPKYLNRLPAPDPISKCHTSHFLR